MRLAGLGEEADCEHGSHGASENTASCNTVSQRVESPSFFCLPAEQSTISALSSVPWCHTAALHGSQATRDSKGKKNIRSPGIVFRKKEGMLIPELGHKLIRLYRFELAIFWLLILYGPGRLFCLRPSFFLQGLINGHTSSPASNIRSLMPTGDEKHLFTIIVEDNYYLGRQACWEQVQRRTTWNLAWLSRTRIASLGPPSESSNHSLHIFLPNCLP